jgi:hypothetical protein
MGRRLCCFTLIALTLWAVGCHSAPGRLRNLSLLPEGAKDRSLRKQVEADSFPSAKQVGLQKAE